MNKLPAADARGAKSNWFAAALAYGDPRAISMLFLGFSSGLPFMLVFNTLSAWLRQSGIDRATIGMLAWVGIVLTIKFLWAPIIDRVRLPLLYSLLGRRRSWMLVGQVGVIAGLVVLSRAEPTVSILYIALSALAVAFFETTQDIAVDAWRIEVAPAELRGVMAATYQFGYRIAVMVASAGALWIAADHGWHVAYLCMAAMGGVGIVATLCTREPEARTPQESVMREQRVIDWMEHRRHWPAPLRRVGAHFVSAVVSPLIDFFARFGSKLALAILVFASTYRLTDYVMGVMANPFYLDHGYTLKQIAAVVKGYGLVASLVGVLVGGAIVARLGAVRALIVGSVMVMLSNIGFSILATTTAPTLIGLAAANSLDNLALGIHGTALVAFLSGLTSASYTATQYALLSSLYALPGKVLMGTSGFVVEAIGYPRFFLYTASLSLPALMVLYWLTRNSRTTLFALPQTKSSSVS